MVSDRTQGGAGDEQAEVIAFLGNPASHPGAGKVKRIDTHAAIIFLAGRTAYKIKRAVTYPFLDFSSLEKRKAACEHEIEVNAANAPQIYDRVVAITRRGKDGLEIDGAGEPVEWAVRMRRFDETKTLDKIIEAGPLPDRLIDALAHALVQAHARAPVRDAGAWIDDLFRYVKQNAEAFADHGNLFPAGRAEYLTGRSVAIYRTIRPLLEKRGKSGHVRLCHGDAHLGNIVLIENEPVLFDAIEFDDVIATADVLYDLAFLLMDLWERGHLNEANRTLNRYLVESGCADHYDGLAAMPFFLMMRAAIRSKVTASRREFYSGRKREDLEAQALAYFDAAVGFLDERKPVLVAVGGLSGTGKTTIAAQIAATIGRAPGAIILRSDIFRKRLAGVGEFDRLPDSAYAKEASNAVYGAISKASARILNAGHSVVADAVFADPAERESIERIADESGVRFFGLWLNAPTDVLLARVGKRRGDASDADRDVVIRQAGYDPGEISWTWIDASGSMDESVENASKALAVPGRGHAT